MANFKLYHYWRSSCSWRVRWAFAMKGIECEWVAVNLLKNETTDPAHLSRNPMGVVPVLERLDQPEGSAHRFLSESVAIIEWCEEAFPRSVKLLPSDLNLRSQSRELAQLINAGTQPLQNLGVLKKLSSEPAAQKEWSQHWIKRGLLAYEQKIKTTKTAFSLTEEPSYADLFLVPQIYNAIRNELDLSLFPRSRDIYERALKLESCQKAHPDRFGSS